MIDDTITFRNEPSLKLLAGKDELAYVSTSFTDDPTHYDYLDIYLNVTDVRQLVGIQVDFAKSNGGPGWTFQAGTMLKKINQDGWRYLHIPLAWFSPRQAEATWDGADLIKISVRGGEVNVGAVQLVQQARGAAYMYFDDGYANQYETAFPIMSKYHLSGTIAVITSIVGTKGRVSWDQIREMNNAGWSVASHTVTHVELSSAATDIIKKELEESSESLKAHGFPEASRMLVVPGGAWSNRVDEIARNYYDVVRTETATGVAGPWQEYPPSHPRYQPYISPTNQNSVEQIKGWIDEAIRSKRALHLAWHQIVPSATATYMYPSSDFEEIVAYLKSKVDAGLVDVPTMKDTLKVAESRELN